MLHDICTGNYAIVAYEIFAIWAYNQFFDFVITASAETAKGVYQHDTPITNYTTLDNKYASEAKHIDEQRYAIIL